MKAHTPTENEIRDGRIAALEARDDEIKRLHDINAYLLNALKFIAQLQDDKIGDAPDELILALLRIKVSCARAAISKASTS